MKTDLSKYDNSWYLPGSFFKRLSWYIINELFLRNPLNISSGLKVFWLRLFGANIGKGVVIKPHINIKYPWKLNIGNHCWIGEDVWIDNLDTIIIEDNVCVSQGAFLICGNHNYKKTSFDLMIGAIILKEGCWVGAKSIVGPGVTMGSHSVLSLGSVASDNLEALGIYRGNPAIKIKLRTITN
ncbi:WcaF family extracellular polysaccharide biosynthesis acetyltransferase [uncultured Gelidibacter sp.]|uniref:WcaF family extracellular polysaccharide biosynthesis acetyltransferase n=1 Tax=uncultured Gelidibacter sp. TaxID=259318 RepID=UPI00260F99C8|nr:WcaF family extracellular polysaccharide biosynthesis acetyltransferase [uncultured Gelidibacter sp.]